MFLYLFSSLIFSYSLSSPFIYIPNEKYHIWFTLWGRIWSSEYSKPLVCVFQDSSTLRTLVSHFSYYKNLSARDTFTSCQWFVIFVEPFPIISCTLVTAGNINYHQFIFLNICCSSDLRFLIIGKYSFFTNHVIIFFIYVCSLLFFMRHNHKATLGTTCFCEFIVFKYF